MQSEHFAFLIDDALDESFAPLKKTERPIHKLCEWDRNSCDTSAVDWRYHPPYGWIPVCHAHRTLR